MTSGDGNALEDASRTVGRRLQSANGLSDASDGSTIHNPVEAVGRLSQVDRRLVDTPSAKAYGRYRLALENHLREGCRTLGLSSERVETVIKERLRRDRGEALADVIDKYVGLREKRLLDVGAGVGELVLVCLARGAEVTGVEPDESKVFISGLLLESFGYEQVVQCAFGEAMPFGNDEFDIVTCQQVLEHIPNREAVVDEMVRVCRPGGHLIVSVPNYLFPYEGHYRMKWFPLTPKLIGKLVLRLTGRDPNFLINHVYYTTYPAMMRLWRRKGLEIVNNVTRERIVSGRERGEIYDRPFVKTLALRLNLYPNVTWVLKKPKPSS